MTAAQPCARVLSPRWSSSLAVRNSTNPWISSSPSSRFVAVLPSGVFVLSLSAAKPLSKPRILCCCCCCWLLVQNRLLFMLQDADDAVVAQIIQLMQQLYARDRLDEEETKRPWALCFAANRDVAHQVNHTRVCVSVRECVCE